MIREAADGLFSAIAALPPDFSTADAAAIASSHYGLTVSARPLVSERDQNFLLEGDDGRSFVLKIANASEDPAVTEFQVAALEHVARSAPGERLAPSVLRARDGAALVILERGDVTHRCRVVTYLTGTPLSEVPIGADLCRRFGRFMARLDLALADLSHPGAAQPLLWDMQRALELRALLVHVEQRATRRLLETTLDGFEAYALPRFADVRAQVIHNDANPGNVLVTDDAARIAGIIDFGDMLRAPRVVEIAVACAYLRSLDGDPFAHLGAFVAGYDAESRLHADEIALLHDAIKTRLATTIAIMSWRASLRSGDDAYLVRTQASESSAAAFLERLAAVPRERATETLAAVCGR